MLDIILRRKALEVAERVWLETGDANVTKIWRQLKALPSAQSERKIGKWIRIGGSEKCSVCGYICDDEYYIGNFCQNCGAKMKGETDE